MNLISLSTFLAVVRTRNLNKAAEQLHVTQSTVTARLDTLEEALGQRLLVRSRRGAELTKAGFAFQRHAELMVQTWDLARKTVGLPKDFSGLFSLACHGEFWEGLGDRLVDRIRDDLPDLALEAWPGELADIQRWLSSGLVDAALSPEVLGAPGLASRELTQDRLVQVSSVKRAAQRWDPAYVFVDLGAAFRSQHARAWPVEETAHMTFGSSFWALSYLLRHGGSAYLPWRLAEPHVAAGRLFQVSGSPEFSRPVHLIWREASLATHPWIRALSLNTIRAGNTKFGDSPPEA